MLVLALETSTETGSVALLEDGQVVACRDWRREKSHSELLTSKISECFSEAQQDPKSINRVAVGVGPGSFTGIRIALNAAKVFAFAANVPVYAADTFRILAEPTRHQNLPVVGLINAHKNLIYTAALSLKKESETKAQYSLSPDALSIAELEDKIQIPHLALGNGFEIWKESFSKKLISNLVRDPHFSDDPQAAHLGRIATTVEVSDLINWQTVQPLYIRASEPEEKLKAGFLTDRSRINE